MTWQTWPFLGNSRHTLIEQRPPYKCMTMLYSISLPKLINSGRKPTVFSDAQLWCISFRFWLWHFLPYWNFHHDVKLFQTFSAHMLLSISACLAVKFGMGHENIICRKFTGDDIKELTEYCHLYFLKAFEPKTAESKMSRPLMNVLVATLSCFKSLSRWTGTI